jgi:hypothetical protein
MAPVLALVIANGGGKSRPSHHQGGRGAYAIRALRAFYLVIVSGCLGQHLVPR